MVARAAAGVAGRAAGGRAVVVGSGPAGSACALALARAGWSVTVVDRDASVAAPARPGAVEAVEGWSRAGVAQFHQPHAFLARLFDELRADLPDVLDAVLDAGAVPVTLPGGLSAAWCRRSVLELVLHAAVAAEPGVELVADDAAAVELDGGRVRGVALRSGGALPADLVVDAGGRRSRLTRAWREEGHDEPSEEVYTSRRYRLRPGAAVPVVNRGVIAVAESDGYAALVFPHDAGTFTAALTRLPEDEALAAWRHEDAFEASLRLVPMTAEWVDPAVAEPVSGVRVMAGLRNAFHPLRADAPLGLHAVGDVVSTTNPHFGRGTALSVAGALRLARAVAADPADARSWRAATTAWERGELLGWCEDGRELDRSRALLWRAAAAGEPLGPVMASIAAGSGPRAGAGGGGVAVPRLLVLAAAGAEPRLRPVVLRHMHLVSSPGALTEAAPLVARLLADGWRPEAGEGDAAPPRAELVAALADRAAPVRA